jgi:CHAT domain-containing protein/Flp pilus assembly protein TadD
MSEGLQKKLGRALAVLFIALCAVSVRSRPRMEFKLSQRPATAANVDNALPLQVGKLVERTIAGGQTHSYQIEIRAGQSVDLTVEQRGIDVAENVFGPDGKLIVQYNSEQGVQKAYKSEFVGDVDGVYRLDVEAKIKHQAGTYRIRIDDIRTASDHDRSLMQVNKLSTESSIRFRAGKFEEASRLAEQAVAIAEKASAPETYLGYLLNELGKTQREKGEYAKAETSLERAVSINQKLFGLEHPQTIESISGLGLVYRSRGDYPKALRALQQALELTEQLFGPTHPKLAASLTDIELVHIYLGDFEQANRDLQRALSIAETTLEPDDPLLGRIYNNFAHFYVVKKDYERAETFAQTALKIYEKSLGPDHPDLTYPLINLGRIAHERKQKNYARSLEMYGRALAIREHALGRDDIDVAGLINNIANIHKATGDYAKALEMYQRALRIAEMIAGPYHVASMILLGNIANLYRVQGDATNAIVFQRRLDERLEMALGLNLTVGSERQKLNYFNSIAERTDRTISLHVNLAPDDRDACALAALVLLQRKGRVLDAMSGSLTALRQRSDPDDQRLLDRLNSITAQLAKLVLGGPQNTTENYQSQLNELQEQKEKLETEISNRSAEFRAQSQPVTLAKVQAAIPKDAALIEFTIYRPFDPKLEGNQYGKPRYVAYVLRQQGEVEWRELGDAQAIDDAIEKLRQALRDPLRSDVRELARVVDQEVMQPVRGLLAGAMHLLISPDGEMNLIPFEALVDEHGRYLVQSYAVTYLTSGRDLLRMEVAKQGSGVPIVIANPSFGEPTAEPIAKVRANGNSDLSNRRRSVTNAHDFSEIYFAPLEGTANESRRIQKLFPSANILSGSQATESALKGVVAPPLLHVATHGFFLQDATASASANLQVATRGISANAKIENPLLRSGLALAGANLRTSKGEDGIFTALEASGLNLWGTKLVVLSACDTGVGEVHNHEGVYGLRRAFVLAGSQSLVMSLWPVSDYSARTLMANYYRNLKLGLGRGAALRQVQLEALKKNKELHPFYWANFIQSGEWANLAGKR